MKEPKRWSDPESEVDPVLRSVARYGQRLEPDDAVLQRLILTTANRRAHERVRPGMRPFTVGVALGLAAVCGGVAWASVGRGWFSSAAAPAVEAVPRPTPAAPAERSRSLPPPSTPPVAAPSSEASAAPRAPVVTSSSATPGATAMVSAESVLQDSGLLQQARASIGDNPARALTLTRDHEVRFPSSLLVEERQALRIEALARLSRGVEAASELQSFEGRFPRSPYRRRLRSLVAP